MRKPFLLALVVLLIACATPVYNDFEHQRKKWREADIAHYRFELSMICFCPFRHRMPLQIEVLNGQVVMMKDNSDRPVTAADGDYRYFSRYATFDRLFSELQSNLSGKRIRSLPLIIRATVFQPGSSSIASKVPRTMN